MPKGKVPTAPDPHEQVPWDHWLGFTMGLTAKVLSPHHSTEAGGPFREGQHQIPPGFKLGPRHTRHLRTTAVLDTCTHRPALSVSKVLTPHPSMQQILTEHSSVPGVVLDPEARVGTS